MPQSGFPCASVRLVSSVGFAATTAPCSMLHNINHDKSIVVKYHFEKYDILKNIILKNIQTFTESLQTRHNKLILETNFWKIFIKIICSFAEAQSLIG